MRTYSVIKYVHGARIGPVATRLTHEEAVDFVQGQVLPDWGKDAHERPVRYSVEEERGEEIRGKA